MRCHGVAKARQHLLELLVRPQSTLVPSRIAIVLLFEEPVARLEKG
jgi:hypothetical protein